MSARRIPLAMFPDSAEWVCVAEYQQMQTNALDMLETCVKEAKDVVHETQTKMDELAKSIDKIKDPKEDTHVK